MTARLKYGKSYSPIPITLPYSEVSSALTAAGIKQSTVTTAKKRRDMEDMMREGCARRLTGRDIGKEKRRWWS